jgi:hypothetical protein
VKAHPYYFENCELSGGSVGSDPTIRFRRITTESITEIMNGWKNSPGHNAAMLDEKVKYIGFFTKSKYQKRKNNYSISYNNFNSTIFYRFNFFIFCFNTANIKFFY